LLTPCCPVGGTSPAIVLTESNAAGVTTANCQCATVGERCPHGSGDCCSGSCSVGICQCLPLGSRCSGAAVAASC
jgi:hypothetical protein